MAFCLLAVLLVAWAAGPLRADGPGWTESVRVATGVTYPAAALDGKGNVHLAWVDQSDSTVRHLIVGRSPTVIPSPSRSNYFPSLAADGQGRVHAVWDGGSYVLYACWDGQRWSDPVTLPRQERSANEAQVAVDEGGQPHVIFWSSGHGSASSQWTPWYTRRVDGHWLAPRRLPDAVPSSSRLSFLVREGKVHVAFLYQRSDGLQSVGYACSTNGGADWSPVEDVAGARAPVWAHEPSLVVQDGVSVVAWVSDDPQTQQPCSWYARRVNGQWTPPARLVQGAGGQLGPVVIWDGERLLVAWQQNAQGFVQQIAVTSTDPNTGSSAPPTVFNWRGIPTMLTADVTPEGEAVVAWATGWSEIYYAYRPPYRPTSSVAALPAVVPSATFLVRWSGRDRSGTGIAGYDVQVKDGDGPWADWLIRTQATSAFFTGQNGHTYRFRSRAIDNAGHIEAWPETCDATTTVLAQPMDFHLYLSLAALAR